MLFFKLIHFPVYNFYQYYDICLGESLFLLSERLLFMTREGGGGHIFMNY